MKKLKYYYCMLPVLLAFIACKEQVDSKTHTEDVASKEIENVEIKVEEPSIAIEKANQQEYPIKYTEVKSPKILTDYQLKGWTVENALQIKDINLVSGTLNDRQGVRLFVKDGSGKELFKSKGQQDSWWLKLTLYTSSVSSRDVVVIGEIGAEESWGAYVYKYDGVRFFEVGFLDLIALNEYKESQSIVPYLEIVEHEKDELSIDFKEGILIYDNLSKKELKGKDLNYRSSQGKFLKI